MVTTYKILFCISFHFIRIISKNIYSDHVDIPIDGSFILLPSDEIWSISVTSYITMQLNDGNFVFYRIITDNSTSSSTAVWNSKTAADDARYVEISSSGNIMIIGTKGKDDAHIFWQSETGNHETTQPHRLVVRDESFYLLDANSDIIYTPSSNCGTRDGSSSNQLPLRQPLYVMIPINASYTLCSDDFIFSDYASTHTETRLIMQAVANLVLIAEESGSAITIWKTNITTIGAKYTEISSDGNIAVKDASSDVIYFESNTGDVNNMKYQLQFGVVPHCAYLRNNDLNEIIWNTRECVIPHTHNTNMIQHTSTTTSFQPTEISSQPTQTPLVSTTNPSSSPVIYVPETSFQSTQTPLISSTNPSSSPVFYLTETSSQPTQTPSESSSNPTTSSSSIHTTTSPVQYTSAEPIKYPITNTTSESSTNPRSTETSSVYSTETSLVLYSTETSSVYNTERSQMPILWIVIFSVMGLYIGFVCCACFMMFVETNRQTSDKKAHKYMVDVHSISDKARKRPALHNVGFVDYSHSDTDDGHNNDEDKNKEALTTTGGPLTPNGPNTDVELQIMNTRRADRTMVGHSKLTTEGDNQLELVLDRIHNIDYEDMYIKEDDIEGHVAVAQGESQGTEGETQGTTGGAQGTQGGTIATDATATHT